MNGQRHFSDRHSDSQYRSHKGAPGLQGAPDKELYIWSEEQHQIQLVSVHFSALRNCLKNDKDPLHNSSDARNNHVSATTSARHGSRHGDRGGRSSRERRGSMQHTSRGNGQRDFAATATANHTSPHGQPEPARCGYGRHQNSRGGHRGHFNGNAPTGHAARPRTSSQKAGLACNVHDRLQYNQGSMRGGFTANHRPHRSRNAIEVVEALDSGEQTRLLQAKVGMLVNKRYEVQQMLDQGSYGQIYVGFDHLLLRKVAVKFDDGKRKAERTSHSKRNHLKVEYDIYTAIRKSYPCGKLEGIPEPYWYGEEFGFRILALELLGASLHALFTFCDYKFGLETVFEIGKQMLERIRVVHENGFIHCDIKPENFLMGVGGEENVLYLIDFGLSRKYRHVDEDGMQKHISQERSTKNYVGTAKYASLNSLRCQALSRRDDLESVAYVLAEMIKGEAPFRKARRWHGEDVRLNKRERYLHAKEQVDWDRACPQMAAFVEYCKRLAFEEEPDYDYLLKCLRHATTRNIASYPSLTMENLECFPCRLFSRKKALAELKRDARPLRLNDSIVSGSDAQMAAAMRRSSAFPPAICGPQLSCKTDIDLGDCQVVESSGFMDFAKYAQEAHRFGWKDSRDSVLDSRKCRRCEERLKSFYDAENQRTGELSWHVRRRVNDAALTLYGHRFWWTTSSCLNACKSQN